MWSTWRNVTIAVCAIAGSHAVAHAADLIITDPAYVDGTVTLGSDPLTSGTVTLRTTGYEFTGNIDSAGAYGPVVVQSTAEDGTTLLSYSSELRARFAKSADILSGTQIRIRRNNAGLQVNSNQTETHDYTYDTTQVKHVALTLRMASGSPGTLDAVRIFTNEVTEGDERYTSYSGYYTSLGNVTERTFILPVVGSSVVTVRGTVRLRTDDGNEVSRSLDPMTVDLGSLGPYAIEWPAFDLSGLDDKGAIEVSMDLVHPTPPTVTARRIWLLGVTGTPTEGFNRTFTSPDPQQKSFTIPDLIAGQYTVNYARTDFDGGQLAHPYSAQGNSITVPAGGTATYDVDVELVNVTGNIEMSGMLTPSSVSRRFIQAQGNHTTTSPTRGGNALFNLDKDTGDFSLWLPRGPWRIWRHYVNANEQATADDERLSAQMYTDHNFYGDAFQDFQADTDIGAPVQGHGIAPVTMTSIYFDVDEPLGEPDIDLRCPYLNGRSSQTSKRTYIYASGSCNAQPVQELRFLGEPGTYTVDARVDNASNGSRILFDNVEIILNQAQYVDDMDPVVLQAYSPGPPELQQVEVTPTGVTSSGFMSVLESPIGPNPGHDFRIMGGSDNKPNYYNITISNDLTLSGARVCIGFPDQGSDATEQQIEMQHFTNGAWEILPNQMVDTVNNIACADTTSFSPFVLTLPLPHADAGADQTVCVASEAEIARTYLDGTGSSDPLGGALAYTWSQDGTDVATGATPTVDLGVGAHTFSLVVSGSGFESSPDDVVVTVDVCQSSCNVDSSLWDTCTPGCPCSHGTGDCDSDDECADGLRCLHDAGLLYGYDDAEVDVCVAGCPSEGAGSWNFCTPECPCDDGAGDCDSDDECADGLRCLHDAGLLYGYDDAEIDVCVAGCPSEGAGAWNFCTADCPCEAGQGDCDSDDECAGGLHCAHDAGARYGFDAEVDVCE